jgi:serine/threonine protein kinase
MILVIYANCSYLIPKLAIYGRIKLIALLSRKDLSSAAIVAVKIIDIDESDTLDPRNADSYSEFLKEINALQMLSENKARNINHVIEALPVGKAMWMVTEYCGGGSISTLVSHGQLFQFRRAC